MCAENPSDIDQEIDSLLEQLAKGWGEGTVCYPLLLNDDNITPKTVDRVFDELQELFAKTEEANHLVVLVDSGGGDINAAYNLALLFRSYPPCKLTYVVPRWAKSAATLLVCGGDSVAMTPVAELGPLDPQITQITPFEGRLENFSPLHIESTLELIRNEFDEGNKELANGLLQRLQFPITLGSFKKSLDVGKQYAHKLLASRMLKDNEELALEVAKKLVEDYADHGFCINISEAESLGLVVQSLSSSKLTLVWKIHKLAQKKVELLDEKRRKEMAERI